MRSQVAILAAGRGRRLQPLTDDVPKALLPVGGASPLERALQSLTLDGRVSELLLVLGHGRDRVERFLSERTFPYPIRRIFNPRYETTNNILSAHLLAEHVSGEFLLLNSDVICDPAILADALDGRGRSFLVIDPAKPPRAEAMKVRYQSGRLTAIGKELDPATADGEYVGIAGFDAAGARAFFQAAGEILDRGGVNEWYEAAIAEAAREVAFGMRSTEGLAWIEIDDPDDLERATRELGRLRGK